MKKIVLLLAVSVLAPLYAYSQDAYRIQWVSPSPITIDSRAKASGDTFGEYSFISWNSDDQAMKVTEIATERSLWYSAKAIPEKREGSIHDYVLVARSLSVRNALYLEQKGEGARYFILYEKNGEKKELEPVYGMFMDELPRELWLCRFDPVKGSVELVTKDFRSFVDDLIVTDGMVRRILEEEVFDEQAYLALMHYYLEGEHRDIPFDMEDVNLFISLKY